MQSGNGIDLAAVYQLLIEVAQTVRDHSGRFDRIEARFDSHTQKLNELSVVVNDHTRKLDQLANVVDDVTAGLRELRLTVYQYHEAVVGHGIEMTRLGERVTRIEAHLNLDATAS